MEYKVIKIKNGYAIVGSLSGGNEYEFSIKLDYNLKYIFENVMSEDDRLGYIEINLKAQGLK